jgi:hypothetical protein
MPLSLAQLRTRQTEEQVLAFILDTLASLGFRVGSWHDGSVQRNLLTAVARNSADASGVVADLVNNLIDNPNGDWADLLGKWFYRVTRDPGAKAVRTITFTSPRSAPPTVIERGTQVRAGSVSFSVKDIVPSPPNVLPFTMAPNTSQVFEVIADKIGVDGNTGVAPRIIGKGGLRADWLDTSVLGADRESDARYLTRCELRFAALTYSISLRAYEFLALTADPSIARVRAYNVAPDTNAINVILDAGTPSQITNVAAYLVGKNPPRDVVTVAARVANSQNIVVRPRVPQGMTAAQVQAILQATLDTMPIGGWTVVGAPAGRLLPERLTEALLCKNGASSAGVVTPAAPVILAANEIVAPIFDIQVAYG